MLVFVAQRVRCEHPALASDYAPLLAEVPLLSLLFLLSLMLFMGFSVAL
jgi:hypothetical protein